MTCLFKTNRSGLSYDRKELLERIFMNHETNEDVDNTNNNQPKEIDGIMRINMHVGCSPCKDIGLRINKRIQKWLVREEMHEEMFNDRLTSLEDNGQLKFDEAGAKSQDNVNCHVRPKENQTKNYLRWNSNLRKNVGVFMSCKKARIKYERT